MSKDTSGAQKRIEKALIHRLLMQSKMGQSKHAAKQAAREAWLASHGNLKGWNPAKAEGIYSRARWPLTLELRLDLPNMRQITVPSG